MTHRLLAVLTAAVLIGTSCERSGTGSTTSAEPPDYHPVVPATAGSAPDWGDTISFPDSDAFLPQEWIAAPISAATSPLAAEHQDTARTIIEAALAKYPRKLLFEFLDGVSLVGSLRFYDVGYGGTYMANSRRIVLVYKPEFDPRGFEQRFHHEFSSLLLKRNESLFPAERWKNGNPAGFVYRAPGVIEEQKGEKSEATRVLEEEQKKTGGSGSNLLRVDRELLKHGFLTEYNQVSLEQDVNETAAHLFTNPQVWEFCSLFPRFDHKIDVLVDFYRELDPVFDRLYFRHLTMPPTEASAPNESLPPTTPEPTGASSPTTAP